jgi:hypothetical protein
MKHKNKKHAAGRTVLRLDEDARTAGGCRLEGNRWRAGAGAPVSCHDPTLAQPGAPRRHGLVCVEGWSWSVERNRGMLDGALLGWECPIQWASSLENRKKNRNKTADYRLKMGSWLNRWKMTKPFLSCILFLISRFCFHLVNTKTVSKKRGS